MGFLPSYCELPLAQPPTDLAGRWGWAARTCMVMADRMEGDVLCPA